MALQRNSGISFGIVLFIGLIQVRGLCRQVFLAHSVSLQIASWFPWRSFTPAVRLPTNGMVHRGGVEEATETLRLLPADRGSAESEDTTDAANGTGTDEENGRTGERPPGNPWTSE